MKQHERARQSQIEVFIPMIWQHKKYLYVGANVDRFHFWLPLAMAFDVTGALIDVLEIDEERATEVRKKYPWINEVFIADVTGDGPRFLSMVYDVVIWSHGPALLSSVKEIDAALEVLEAAGKLVIVLTPWGEHPYPKGAEDYVNSLDWVKLPLQPEFFVKQVFGLN